MPAMEVINPLIEGMARSYVAASPHNTEKMNLTDNGLIIPVACQHKLLNRTPAS